MGRNEFMLGFRVPTTCGKKTLTTTYSGEVSPPPANRTTTQCETGGETGSETGGEIGSETGGEIGSGTGARQGARQGVRQGARQVLYNGSVFCLAPCLTPCLAPYLDFSVPTKMLQCKVPTTCKPNHHPM